MVLLFILAKYLISSKKIGLLHGYLFSQGFFMVTNINTRVKQNLLKRI